MINLGVVAAVLLLLLPRFLWCRVVLWFPFPVQHRVGKVGEIISKKDQIEQNKIIHHLPTLTLSVYHQSF